MRITGGKFKGQQLFPPKGIPARPTTDRTKISIFNILQHRYAIGNADVLDLFAGTGSISFEFISLGASQVTSVELNRKASEFIKETCRKLKIDNCTVVVQDVRKYLEQAETTFDIIFMDPPYDLPEKESLIKRIFEKKILNEDGVLLIEHSAKDNFENVSGYIETRNYGICHISLFEN